MEFTLKTKIKATAKEIYTAWLNSEGHTKMTGGEAVVSDKVGDTFTAWDGYIEGTNIELEPYRRILQSWRTLEFKENESDSQIEIFPQVGHSPHLEISQKFSEKIIKFLKS